ncbi:uncharacterized protein LOC117582116 [Drosophila guanche]|uniref:Uncharacterized protein n=1 Tax=Drosophila guanche TaxID=7266 RepID=A0A3B0JBE9_DROGU|nr:uncharacterized protein LOC117582116 [Drosophila guanche]SPP79355.1 Hypothetical predicted protein [Drosophila guanche]
MALNTFAQWLVSCAMGVATVANVLRHCKVANDKETVPRTVSMTNTAAIECLDLTIEEESAQRTASKPLDHSDMIEPPALGSEMVSAALQRLFSSKDNCTLDRSSVYIAAMHNNANRQEYTLGSEALNRILEGLQVPTGGPGVTGQQLSFEPPENV